MKNKYEIDGKSLFITTKLSATTDSVFISMDEVDELIDANPSIAKIKIGHQAGGSYHYETSVDALRLFIETSESVEIISRKGKEGYLIPIGESPFIKVVNKSTDSDRWLSQRARIIKESGGPWSEEQRLAWKQRFAYVAPEVPSV